MPYHNSQFKSSGAEDSLGSSFNKWKASKQAGFGTDC